MKFLDQIKGTVHEAGLIRFLINTIFDSTFVTVGIIIGIAFSGSSDIKTLIGTVLTASIALAISTSTSVYEAETFEEEKRIVELEKAMLISLKNTAIVQSERRAKFLVTIIVCSTPIITALITITPFLLAWKGFIKSIGFAAFLSIAIALGILFVTGTYAGKSHKINPLKKGTRMVIIGLITFTICFYIESLV